MANVNLFKLLTSTLTNTTCFVVIDGIEIIDIHDYADEGVFLKCSGGDDGEWFFADQEVYFDDGKCIALATNEFPNYTYAATIGFKVIKPLKLSDIGM